MPRASDTLSLHAERFRSRRGRRWWPWRSPTRSSSRIGTPRSSRRSAARRSRRSCSCSRGGWFLVRKVDRAGRAVDAYTRRFMADAAHELRTPIAVLRTKAEVALQAPRSAGRRTPRRLRGMEAGGAAARPHRGRSAHAGAGGRRRASGRARTILSRRRRARRRALGAHARAGRGGQNCSSRSSRRRRWSAMATLVRELVVVLLDNAVKFTPPGGSVHGPGDARAASRRVSVRGHGDWHPLGPAAARLRAILSRRRGAPAQRRRGPGAVHRAVGRRGPRRAPHVRLRAGTWHDRRR